MTGTQGSEIRSAEDLASWNRAHAEIALPSDFPSQAFIERSIAYESSSKMRRRFLEHIERIGKSLTAAMDENDINVIIGPGDSKLSLYSATTGQCNTTPRAIQWLGMDDSSYVLRLRALANFMCSLGYPACSLPLGSIEYLGRPVGLVAIARSEATLVTLMSAFEASFRPRQPPHAFLSHEKAMNSF